MLRVIEKFVKFATEIKFELKTSKFKAYEADLQIVSYRDNGSVPLCPTG